MVSWILIIHLGYWTNDEGRDIIFERRQETETILLCEDRGVGEISAESVKEQHGEMCA